MTVLAVLAVLVLILAAVPLEVWDRWLRPPGGGAQ